MCSPRRSPTASATIRPTPMSWRSSSRPASSACMSTTRTSIIYITTLNENYPHPAMPEGAEEGILAGMYSCAPSRREEGRRCACGCSARARSCARSRRRAELLAKDFGVSSEIWSVTSFTELRRDGLEVDRWNMLHPEARAARLLCRAVPRQRASGPVIAATDYMKAIADGIRPFVPARYKALGTDGFGRSDYRRRLRSFFEVDRYHVAVAALKALADDQLLPSKTVREAIDTLRDRPRAAEPGAELSSDNSLQRCSRREKRSWPNDRSESSRHRRFQGRADHRDPGEAGRRGQGRAVAGDARIRQGDDGRAGAERRRRRAKSSPRSATKCRWAR